MLGRQGISGIGGEQPREIDVADHKRDDEKNQDQRHKHESEIEDQCGDQRCDDGNGRCARHGRKHGSGRYVEIDGRSQAIGFGCDADAVSRHCRWVSRQGRESRDPSVVSAQTRWSSGA